MGKGRSIPLRCVHMDGRCGSARWTGEEAVCAATWSAAAVAQEAGPRLAGDAAGDVGLTDGEAVAEAVADAAGAERAGALGPATLTAAALWPVSVTSSAIAVAVTARPPAPTATPDRKLISSIRA